VKTRLLQSLCERTTHHLTQPRICQRLDISCQHRLTTCCLDSCILRGTQHLHRPQAFGRSSFTRHSIAHSSKDLFLQIAHIRKHDHEQYYKQPHHSSAISILETGSTMPGSHDPSVENLRLHEHIVGSEKRTHHVVKTMTSAPTARQSARPPAKPETVARPQAQSKAGSQSGSKRGEATEVSRHEKEMLIVTVIEEGEDDENLPPKAPSAAHASSKHGSKKVPSVKPPPSHASNHSHHGRRQSRDIFHIPEGIPPPPGFSRMPDFPDMAPMAPMPEIPMFDGRENREMALVRTVPPPPARSVASGASRLVAQRYPASHVSHHSKSSHHSKKSGKSKAIEGDGKDSELVDVLVEEVHEVTKRRFVVKVPAEKARDFRFAD
jgi:hypothetical protein